MIRWYMDVLYETFCSIVFDQKDPDKVWVFPRSFFSALLSTSSLTVVLMFENIVFNVQSWSQLPFPPKTVLQLIMSVLVLIISLSASMVVTGIFGLLVRLIQFRLRRYRNRRKPSQHVQTEEKHL